MNADDDWYAERFTVMRMTWSSEQDLLVLKANGLVHVFDDNVLIVLDRKENNYIQKDRYTPSKYLTVYNLDTECIQNVYTGKDRIGKERLDKVSISTTKVVETPVIWDDWIIDSDTVVLTGEIVEKEKSSAKKEKDTKPITIQINELINKLKDTCDRIGVAYNKEKEREFAKHLITAAEYWKFCSKISQTREDCACNILLVSVKIGYWRWPTTWPCSIYKYYSEVYNEAMTKKSKQKKSNILVL